VSSARLSPGSLVLYKIHPAIVAEVGDKIAIQLAGGKSKRVRDKDVRLLHPGPVAGLGVLNAADPALDEAWELIEGETITLADLAEFLFGDFSPASAWGAWEALADGLYFEGDIDAISRRPADAVAEERAAREQKAQAEREWSEFLARVESAELDDGDRKRLAEVERVALGKAERSRILASLGVQETPEGAHRFLVRCGYWPAHENPWPRRVGAVLGPVEIGVPALVDEPRRDLTGLAAWAIDDAGNQDPDDAISIDGDRLWVHVADVAALVRPGGHMDQAARERSANLYLPEGVHPMLPDEVTERLGLGLHDESPALSFGFRFDGVQVTDIEIVASRVRVQRTSYDDADRRMDDAPFAQIRELTDAYRAARLARGAARIDLPEVSVRVVDGEVLIRPLPKLASRDMVTDAMLMAGEAAARFALANGIVIPFAVQPEPDEIRSPQGMAEMYAYRRLFKPSRASLEPGRHFGLGLDAYARATSPLRRYADLLVHQQLRAAVTGGTPAGADEILERTTGLESAGALVRKAERLSNQHWKLVYLARQPSWEGNGVVVAIEERKAVVIVPELALETRVRLSAGWVLGQTLRLGLNDVDLPAQAAYFRVLD
jgi:exoribonuclease-2